MTVTREHAAMRLRVGPTDIKSVRRIACKHCARLHIVQFVVTLANGKRRYIAERP